MLDSKNLFQLSVKFLFRNKRGRKWGTSYVALGQKWWKLDFINGYINHAISHLVGL